MDEISNGKTVNGDENGESTKKLTEETQGCSTYVLKLIGQNAATKNVFMDLANKRLSEIPSLLQGLDHIEYLYLQDNKLEELPENFFSSFPRLKWLDLRNNLLKSLSSTDIGTHKHLQTLLLGQNKIKKLPLDLAYVGSLKALNLGEDQVTFPPPDVVSKGVMEIISFLRNKVINSGKSENEGQDERQSQSTEYTDQQQAALEYIDSSDYASLLIPSSAPAASNTNYISGGGGAGYHLRFGDAVSLSGGGGDYQVMQQQGGGLGGGDYSEALVPKIKISQSATLHKPVAYYQIRQQYLERARKTGSEKKSISRTQSERHNELVNRYPEPPSLDLIERNILDERRKKRMKDVNEKQDAILQRKRDQESVKVWRDESKQKQREKYFEQMKKGSVQVKLESDGRIEEAPFGVKRENMQMMHPDDLAQSKLMNLREEERPQPLNPAERATMEAHRRAEEKQLESRIQTHAMDMRDRSRAPKKTAKEDLEAAQRDMQIAQQLHKEIVNHRDALQYHLQKNLHPD